ncbi:hypothetical protein HNY73_003402 [Argiope bruennichi]|uniref:Uncharacterized protein n=1 Tax=Argiope bruennichi TaxID=94029 RepID=A0A8T0FQG3_ARGBR|nr:hypothetical protein HNY73_003402 [Argiope bruennichi]
MVGGRNKDPKTDDTGAASGSQSRAINSKPGVIHDGVEELALTIKTSDFSPDLYREILDILDEFSVFSDSLIRDKKQFGKGLRNDLVKVFFKPLIEKLKLVYADYDTANHQVVELSAEVFDLKELLTNNDTALLKAKLNLLNEEYNQ